MNKFIKILRWVLKSFTKRRNCRLVIIPIIITVDSDIAYWLILGIIILTSIVSMLGDK